VTGFEKNETATPFAKEFDFSFPREKRQGEVILTKLHTHTFCKGKLLLSRDTRSFVQVLDTT
jgi:hypothetical protein